MQPERVPMGQRTIDEGVIEACRRGDREAFRLLFEAYQDRVYSTALYFFGGDEAAAKDAAQQAFLKIITGIRQFRRDAEFTTWLYRIVINACVDEQRKRRRFIPFGDGFEASRPGEDAPQEKQYRQIEIADSVKAAIAHLKPKLRVAILLKYVEGMSYEEMAAVLNCSKGTVASRLNRGHKILAQRLAHLRAEAVRGE